MSAEGPTSSTELPPPRRPKVIKTNQQQVLLYVVLTLLLSVLPHAFTDDPAVIERATSALRYLALMLLPGAIAFALDGVLIGAADYRFLGRAALAYLVAVVPIAAVVIAVPSLGLAGIWIGLIVWMTLRAVFNARRARAVIGRAA